MVSPKDSEARVPATGVINFFPSTLGPLSPPEVLGNLYTNMNSQPSQSSSSIPRFSSFKLPIPPNTTEPPNSAQNTDRGTESHEKRSRGSRHRDGRSNSPQESHLRHQRRRSRDTSRARSSRSHRRHQEENPPHESLASLRSSRHRQSQQRRRRNKRHEEENRPRESLDSTQSQQPHSDRRVEEETPAELLDTTGSRPRSDPREEEEPPHESLDSTHSPRHHRDRDEEEKTPHEPLASTRPSHLRRPPSERRPATKPYPHEDSEASFSPESSSREEPSPVEGSDQNNQPSEVGLSQNSVPPRVFQGPAINETPLMGLGLALVDSQQPPAQHSRFQYSSIPVSFSSDPREADSPLDDDFWEMDSVGDPDMLRYGRPKNVINYRVGGGGYVLGLGNAYRIDRDQSDHTGVVVRRLVGDPCTREKQERLGSTSDRPEIPQYEQRIRTKPHVAPQSRFQSLIFPDPPQRPDFNQPVKDSSSLDPIADFVPLTTDDWGEPPAIRFFDLKLQLPKNFPTSMEELLTESGCPTVPPKTTDLGLERRTHNNSLIRAAFDHPTDVSAWLKAINYQDIFVRGSESESLPLTKNELHSLAEMKLSLYSKALRKVGQTNHRDVLLLGRLQIGAQLWEREKLLEQWKETLTDNPGYVALWAKYLDFFQTDSPNFSYLECLSIHMDALRTVAVQRREDSQFSSLQSYIFLRLTIFHREAGYHELANSLWQAVLEYCFFRPEDLDDTPGSDHALAAFQTFWESEVARIGEAGSEGWNSASSSDEVPPLSVKYPPQDGQASLIANWTRAERDRMRHLVSRSLDSEDPSLDQCQSVCLFSDIREILELFDGRDSAEFLINAFLCFNHLPPIASPRNIQAFRAWSWDGFLRTGFAEDHTLGLDLWRKKDEEPPKAGEAARNSHPFTYPLHSFLHTSDTLFASPDSWTWFASLPWWKGSQCPGTSEMIQCTLQSLVGRNLTIPHSNDDELIEYYLAFEFSCDPRAAKQAAKKILKERKDFLRGWNCLAMMEWMTGSKERANFMWSSVISNSPNGFDRDILWQSWIWKYLEAGQKPPASYILFSMASSKIDPASIPEPGQHGMAAGPVLMAQTQSFLRDSQSQALAANNTLAYVAYTDCLALLYYLSNWPLRSVLEVYANAITQLEQAIGESNIGDWKEYTAELLYQAQAKLIYHIMKQHPKGVWKPIELRPFFKESLTRFPHNTMIATVWMFIESKILRINRIRTLDELIEKDPANHDQSLDITIPTNPISSILLPIWAEISSARGADRWIVRPLFEKALESSGGARSNLTIWKLYILYELDHVDDVAAAKSVFYRAINACPWSKELAMVGFEKLQRGFSAHLAPSNELKGLKEEKGLSGEEVERLFLVICERHLHVRLDIKEEVVESLVGRLRSRSSQSPVKADEQP